MQIDKVIESEVPKDLSRIKHQLRDILVQNLNHSRDHREVEELANINKNVLKVVSKYCHLALVIYCHLALVIY